MKQVIFPQKSEQKPQKQTKKLLESKGFYMIIAICLVVVGILGYVTSQRTQMNEKLALTEFEPKKVLPVEIPASVSEIPLDTTASQQSTPYVAVNTSTEELKFMKPVDAQISVPFSKDNLLYSKTMEDWRTHMGIDIPGSIGTPVKAAANGVVEQVKTDEMLGSIVIIRHTDQFKTKYCSLQSDILVKEGDAVDIGTVIGGIGNTAASEIADAPHLHFEVLSNGELANPEDFISK